LNFKNGFFTIKDVQIYCKLFEPVNPARKRLVVFHGGPGESHDAELPIARLSDHGITVLFYDQYGSGKSGETPDFLSRLTTEYYVE
jgi:proline iminopeptidase